MTVYKADKQTNRQTDKQTNRQTDKQTSRQTDVSIERQSADGLLAVDICRMPKIPSKGLSRL